MIILDKYYSRYKIVSSNNYCSYGIYDEVYKKVLLPNSYMGNGTYDWLEIVKADVRIKEELIEECRCLNLEEADIILYTKEVLQYVNFRSTNVIVT